MEAANYVTFDSLPEEVLLIVFRHLDAEDLENCEVACRRWREIIRCGIPWKKCVQRLAIAPRLWRNILNQLALDEEKLAPVDYRTIFRCCKQVDRNWRQGKYREITKDIGSPEGYVRSFSLFSSPPTNRYLIRRYWREKSSETVLLFFDRKSLQVERSIAIPNFVLFHDISEDFVLTFKESSFTLFDSECGRWIGVVNEDDGWRICDWRLGGDYLAVYSWNKAQLKDRLRLWKLLKSGETTLLKEWPFAGVKDLIIDDQRLVVSHQVSGTCRPGCTMYSFISLQTLDTERSLSFRKHFGCRRFIPGLVLLARGCQDTYEPVHVLDIASGRFLHGICKSAIATNNHSQMQLINANSKYLIITDQYEDGMSKLSVYDLLAFKEGKKLENCFLSSFTTRHPPFERQFIDDTQIVWAHDGHLSVLDFAQQRRM